MTTAVPNLEHSEVTQQIDTIRMIADAARAASRRCHKQESRDALAIFATELEQSLTSLQKRATDLESLYATMPVFPKPKTSPPPPPAKGSVRFPIPPKPTTPKEPTDE